MTEFLHYFQHFVDGLEKSGRQYIGWCPFHPDKGSKRKGFSLDTQRGLWKCHSCGNKGNVITFLKLRGQPIPRELKRALGPPQWKNYQNRYKRKPSPVETWNPSNPAFPNPEWYKRAKRVIECGLVLLGAPKYSAWKNWLEKRGIQGQGLKRLGFNPQTFVDHPGHWGLYRDRWVVVPSGILIPITQAKDDGEFIIGLKVREPDGDYHLIVGSSDRPLILGCDKPFTFLLESELDAYLLWEIAGDLINIISLGGASKKGDSTTAKLLKKSEKVFVSLDSDETGKKQSMLWMNQLTNAMFWPIPSGWGKDPGKAYENGHGDKLRAWIEAAILKADRSKQASAAPKEDMPNKPKSEALPKNNTKPIAEKGESGFRPCRTVNGTKFLLYNVEDQNERLQIYHKSDIRPTCECCGNPLSVITLSWRLFGLCSTCYERGLAQYVECCISGIDWIGAGGRKEIPQ